MTPPRAAAVIVRESDLPLACPNAATPRWNLHPRVFLPLSAQHPETFCPYCGARYKLDLAPAAAAKVSLN